MVLMSHSTIVMESGLPLSSSRLYLMNVHRYSLPCLSLELTSVDASNRTRSTIGCMPSKEFCGTTGPLEAPGRIAEDLAWCTACTAARASDYVIC